jgi:molybdate transport system regulatory protein
MKKDIQLHLRHWVYVDGVKFFGPGRLELLEGIESTGSIVKAAKAMGMSYKKAWAMVDSLNTHGKQPYVITQTGGQQGGGAQLTETAKKVMLNYRRLNEKLEKVLQEENDLVNLI